MNSPDPNPNEEQIAALLAAANTDAPAPDPAFLAALRESSTAAFQSSIPPTTPRKRTMKLPSLRWIAAIAALLVVGVVFAQWMVWKNRAVVIVDPAPDDKFVMSDKLTDDGRIGKLTDVQGIVSVKAVLAERWSPAPAQLVLKPGDWLRTDSRGANAAALKLLPTTSLIVGPHSTVELTKANEIRLVAGEMEITASAEAPVELLGPDKQSMKIDGKRFVRIDKDKLVRVEKDPLWLQGFKGTSTAESLGSLIATVDGRNVPLTVGYHHVTVDIHDQIARTVIEESFVNRTDNVLEGVFHFPLPQDASISGFGMWIGDKLVEADVVEKQRAREIYETILREKRDPGLLEWAGGNIFKARVYPIPAHSEKRIKISYTQVLPVKGNRYRYSYALQSELLKQHPLRDLTIDVKIHSANAVKSVTSPTHDTRLAMTDHSGHVEFAAQEYTPTRDFEAVVELAARQSDVVVLPHQRGDDGYFLVQLTPPDGPGAWERPLIPNGDPLKLLLLADTSASMDRGQRAAQNALVASLLGALTAKDTINVAACDVNCDWIFEKPVPATAENIATIRDTLAKRVSLGWTNLDKAFASAISQCEPGTHAIYLGDGIPTSGDADPVAFAKRLAKLGEGKPGTFHTVALGSSYEPAAMKAIASLGSGSLRRVSGEQGPQAIVAELLTEIATPSLRNLKVEITGVRTARVYPEELPNVAAGSQQILLGRYLPEGKDQQGEIVVTGTLAGKPVRYVSKFSLKDAEQGNSFLPRLWARMHLDKLLEQGSSQTIKDEIIALSEEFNIITPYTSLLVLETDAERERFAVKRRFQMRDGEKFFADGRDTANYELKQKQMRLAGDHRTALRRSILSQLQGLGRNARLFEERLDKPMRVGGMAGLYLGDEPAGTSSLPRSGEYSLGMRLHELDVSPSSPHLPEPWPNGGGTSDVIKEVQDLLEPLELNKVTSIDFSGSMDNLEYLTRDKLLRNQRDKFVLGGFVKDEIIETDGRSPDRAIEQLAKAIDEREYDPDEPLKSNLNGENFYYHPTDSLKLRGFSRQPSAGKPYYQPSSLPWLGYLIPQLPAPARERKDPKTTWPAEAVALSRSLLRSDKLLKQKGGLVRTREVQGFNTHTNELTSQQNRLELVSPGSWFTKSMPSEGPVEVRWCDAKEMGAIQTAYQLGRIRESNKFDLQQPPLDLDDHSIISLHARYAGYTSKVAVIEKDRALLTLRHPSDPKYEHRYVIDTSRNVLQSVENTRDGTTNWSKKFSDFAEVAGSWWARKIETFDSSGKRTSLETTALTEVSAEEFGKRFAQELKAKEPVLFLKQPLPKVSDAKAAVAAGKGTFDDRAVLTLHFAATQQWSRAQEHLTECERLAGNRPGMRWLTNTFLLASRKQEDLRKRLLLEAKNLTAGTTAESKANAHFLAEAIYNLAGQALLSNEQLAVAAEFEKVERDQPAHLQAMKTLRTRRVRLLDNAGKTEESLALAKALAEEYPRDAYLQIDYTQRLVQTDDYPSAYKWLERALAAKPDANDVDSLRGTYAQFLRNQGRNRELTEYMAKWIALDPATESPYGQYLTALVYSNSAAKAETLADQWLRDGRVKGELPKPTAARLNAAISFARGQGLNYANRIDERWHAALAETALFFARGDEHSDIVGTILGDWRFSSTDAARAARKTLGQDLLKGAGTFTPERIARYLEWAEELETDEWTKIAAELRKRWDAEKDFELKHSLGQSHLRILHRFIGDDDLNFLRVQWKSAAERYRSQYAESFFQALIAREWKAEFEDELFTLLGELAPVDEPAAGLRARIAALHRLTDAMLRARYRASYDKVEHLEKLSRPDHAKKLAEFRKQSRAGFADRLKLEAAKQPKPFSQWLTVERLWLEVQLERDFKAVAVDCWAILDTVAPVVDLDDDTSRIDGAIDAALRDRALITVTHLAARKGADAALIERLVKYIDLRIAAKIDEPRWRAEKYRLLIALDRMPELEAELRRWIALPDPDNRWRLALGYLLAEQGKVAEAIKVFEAVEAADELGPEAYRALADWYQIENRREQAEKARTARYATADENSLFNELRNKSDSATQLDIEVLETFRVLFEKSASPRNVIERLVQFYLPSRDFRLLAALADGIVGQSASGIYSFLQAMSGALAEIRDEATADELVQRIALVRTRSKTAVDLRALDLLEVLVERRAAELQNQPGPHLDKALAALERAFKRDWADGEPRLMAEFLASLGAIAQPALAKEQQRQLEFLHRAAMPGTIDRFRIAESYAVVLKPPPAMDVLEAAIREFVGARGGLLSNSLNDAVNRLITLAEEGRQFERGEKYLLAKLQLPVHTRQRDWLTNRLNQLYRNALQQSGEVSIGKGETLYKALEKKLRTDLGTDDQNRRTVVLTQLVQVYRTAHELKITAAAGDLKAFAFNTLPAILRVTTINHGGIVSDFAGAVHDLAGPRDGIAFLLDRIDDEPDWLRYEQRSAWNQHGDRLGRWRDETKGLDDLEARYLKFVLAELRRDLRQREARGRLIYDRRNQHYWPEKEAEFAKAAEQVLAERKASGDSVEYIAEYLFFGVPMQKRAIEILLATYSEKRLTSSGEPQLVDYLHRSERFAESIPILLQLIERYPDSLRHRTRLMHAYFRTGKQAELLAALKAVDTFFHEKDRWGDEPLAALGASTLENHLFAQSVAYYEELLPRAQQADSNRRHDLRALQQHYLNAADAYAGLGKTKEAVDRASAAIVLWPAGYAERHDSLDHLVKILQGAPKLDEYIAGLDAEKLQSAVVRKALGKALIRKNEHARAIPQLKLSAELQPNDAEVNELLVTCYDKIGDKEGAVRQLLEAVELSRREIKLYGELGRRLAELQRASEAERANTSIVELQPNESESHAMLAEIREKQNRWPEAIAHWERVAQIRSLEPTGLLKLAAAQIHEKAWAKAAESLRKVRSQTWPKQFDDTEKRTRELEKALEEGTKK